MASFIKLRLGAALVLAAAPGAAPLAAQSGVLAYRVRAWPEGVALGLTGASTLVAQQLAEHRAPVACRPCDRARVPGFDRIAIGSVRPVPRRISDVGLIGTVVAAALLARRDGPAGAEWEDVAVIVQGAALTGAATTWAKVLARRVRPHLYDSLGAADPPSYEDSMSFPSGHASVAVAAAVAYAGIQHRRGTLGRRGTETAVLAGTAVLTASLRVAARRHFPSDALAGLALGAALGWIVPQVYAVR